MVESKDIPQNIVERARLTLTDPKGYDWRKFLQEADVFDSGQLLLRLVVDAIRAGGQPILSQLVEPALSGTIETADVDVLLRLKSSRLRG